MTAQFCLAQAISQGEVSGLGALDQAVPLYPVSLGTCGEQGGGWCAVGSG